MDDFVDLITSFPVVIFTGILIFAIAWWLVTTIAGGFDSDGLIDTDGDGFLDDLGDALGAAGVPASVALSLFAFAAWVVALLGTALVRSVSADADADAHAAVGVVIGLVVLAVALVAGALFLRTAARPLRPLFVMEAAPSIAGAIGAFATVRSPRLDHDGGEIIVTSGPVRTAVLRARSDEPFAAGDAVHVVARDDDGTYIVCAIDDALA